MEDIKCIECFNSTFMSLATLRSPPPQVCLLLFLSMILWFRLTSVSPSQLMYQSTRHLTVWSTDYISTKQATCSICLRWMTPESVSTVLFIKQIAALL
jgi:hypothetical protein